jgi:hypothetical protein
MNILLHHSCFFGTCLYLLQKEYDLTIAYEIERTGLFVKKRNIQGCTARVVISGMAGEQHSSERIS